VTSVTIRPTLSECQVRIKTFPPGSEHPRHDDCEGLDGQTVGLGEPFDVNGLPADYPGDPNLPPDESIACRCAVAFTEAGEVSY
jgi:hypothetical protein